MADIVLWLPRGDEHDLAASLFLCDADRSIMQDAITMARDQIARDLPGARVQVKRWHVWRVVRAMARARALNTPEGRALAYALLDDGEQ